jgi:hypothetical protein
MWKTNLEWLRKPYGYFLHREGGRESSYGMDPEDRKKIETFDKYLSQSEIYEHNAKNPENERYKYAIEPIDKYNLFNMTGEPNPQSSPPIITYSELLKHYGPNYDVRAKRKRHSRGGKVRKSRRMDRKSRKGKKPIFTH